MNTKKIHYAWAICLGCFLINFCANGIIFQIFSVFQPFMLSQYHITNTEISGIITVKSIASLIAVWSCGIYYKRFSFRQGMFLAGLISTIGMGIFAITDKYPLFLLASVFNGLGNGFGTTAPIAMVLGRWFKKRRSFALALCSIASSTALLGFPTIVTRLITGISIHFAFLCVTAFSLFLAVMSYVIIRDEPSLMNQLAYGEEFINDSGTNTNNNGVCNNIEKQPESDYEYTLEMLRKSTCDDMEGELETDKESVPESVTGSNTGSVSERVSENVNNEKAYDKRMDAGKGLDKKDWALLIPAGLIVGVISNTGFLHLSLMYTAEGLDPEKVALALSMYGGCLVFGKLSYGYIADKIGGYKTNWIYCSLLTLGLFMICFVGKTEAVLFPGTAILGVGMAICVVGLMTWAGDLSSKEQYDDTVRRCQGLFAAGGIILNMLPGMIADACGSYIPAYIGMVILCVGMLVCIQLLYIRKMKI